MAIAMRLALVAFTAAVTASGKGSNVSNPEKVASAARRASSCNEGAEYWYLTSDADVRAKLGCRTAPAVYIEGHSVTSLAELGSLENAQLISVKGTSVVSLEGLERVSVEGMWHIDDNPSLESLKGLEDKESVHTLRVKNSSSLTSLDGLRSLKSAVGLYLAYLPKVTSLTGLDSLAEVGAVSFYNLPRLTSFAGLGSLATASRFHVLNCGNLASLQGAGGLATVSSLLSIQANDRLESLTGLYSLTSVGGARVSHLPSVDGLAILDNPALSSLSGLESLTYLFDLTISNNSNLLRLSGLERVTTARYVEILDNQGLQTLTGLEGLRSVSKLIIQGNLNIISLLGLRGLRKAGEFRLVGQQRNTFSPGFTNLSGLENLESVQGELKISYWHAQQLSSLVGLSSLTTVGGLTLHFVPGLTSLVGLESLATAGMVSISHTGWDFFSLEGLALHSATVLKLKDLWVRMAHLGGPFVSGASIGEVDIDDSAWPTCITPHERNALVAAVVHVNRSSIPANVTSYPIVAPLPIEDIRGIYQARSCAPATWGTFQCTKGKPCQISIAGEESVFISGRWTGCGRCPESQRHIVTEAGTVDLGLELLDEEGGLRSICRCSGVGGPVAQLLLRGPEAGGLTVCSCGQNCSLWVRGEALERTDHVVLMRQCSDGDPLFAASWTAENVYLLHNPAWYAAAPIRYQVCWRTPCNFITGSPACSPPWGGYFHVGEVDLFGLFSNDHEVMLGDNFSVPNVGLGVSGADRLRLMRTCGRGGDGADSLEADNSGAAFTFGLLARNRVGAGIYHLCWCQERNGVECNADWHFTAESGEVRILCPSGQEFAHSSQRCRTCPAGRQNLQRGLEKCSDCPAGQFSWGGEPCEVCPDGTAAALPGSAYCVACHKFESANDQSTDCLPDSANVFVLAAFLVSLGAFCVTLVLSVRRKLSVVDVSLNQSSTILTTSRSHSFANFGRRSFPVTLCQTGHPGLDRPAEPLRARVQDAVRLELLTSKNEAIHSRLDTSKGILAVPFPHDLYHQKNWIAPTVVVLPVLFAAAVGVGFMVLQLGMVTEAIMGTGAVVVLSAVVSATARSWQHSTPLQLRLREFKQILAEQCPNPTSCRKGPERALTVGKLVKLLDFFRIFIRDRTAYFMDTNILRPLTQPMKLSYAELVGPARVQWFVSHFWGTAFEHFCAALRKHAESVCGTLDWSEITYWVCFCSNNQHQIKEELGEGWADSSFYLTLKSGYCQGTCMVLDDQALPLTRIWCIFELLQTVTLKHNQSDFQGLLLCTSGGVLNSGGGSVEVAMALAKRVGEMDLEKAQASSEHDALMIRTQVKKEMGSFEALNHFVTREVREMLLQARRCSNQNFGAVLAVLDGILADSTNAAEEHIAAV